MCLSMKQLAMWGAQLRPHAKHLDERGCDRIYSIPISWFTKPCTFSAIIQETFIWQVDYRYLQVENYLDAFQCRSVDIRHILRFQIDRPSPRLGLQVRRNALSNQPSQPTSTQRLPYNTLISVGLGANITYQNTPIGSSSSHRLAAEMVHISESDKIGALLTTIIQFYHW